MQHEVESDYNNNDAEYWLPLHYLCNFPALFLFAEEFA